MAKASQLPGRQIDSAALCVLPFQTGDKSNLYYIHEISGSVLQFAPIARRLSAYRNVIGLQCVGLNPGYEADRTIEQMAGRYLDAIDRQAYPPPYDIVGYSMGGLVAFEMAARLAAGGRPVRLLGLIDPPTPGSPGRLDGARIVRMMARTLRAGSVLKADTDDVERLLALLVAEGRTSRVFPAGYTVDDIRPSLDLQLINGHAAEIYRPARTYRSDVRLLAAGSGVLAAKAAGWAPHVEGWILGEEVVADHFSLVQDEAAGLTAVLERWLTEAGR
jgi:thioesterase domain-containing protein